MWNAYTDLMPSTEDVERNFPWALRALLQTEAPHRSELFVPNGPGASRELLVPFQYADDRRPVEPTVVLPDGMFWEALDLIKNGNVSTFLVTVDPVEECHCGRKVHRETCRRARSIHHAVMRLKEDLQARARLPLMLAPARPGDSTLVVDDHDGMQAPTVRFSVVAKEAYANYLKSREQ